jgi:N-acetyl-anhydromuramyl-L-alanine amidase AmpD
MKTITVRVNNRLIPTEAVAACPVSFLLNGAAAATAVSKNTNATGRAEFNATTLADGNYVLTIQPAGATTAPVGPDTAAGSTATRLFRPLSVNVTIRSGIATSVAVANALNGTAAKSADGKVISVTLQPIWMKSPATDARSGPIQMIIIHHTASSTSSSIQTFLSEKSPHYMIDTDGQIIKFVPESLAAQHAGKANWNGESLVNGHSIGIEIVNTDEPYSEAIMVSLLGLLDRLTNKFTTLDVWNIIGHSDVGVIHGHLGRKSGDPGSKFDWRRLEARGWGLIQSSTTFDATKSYAGFFNTVPAGGLQQGDSDAAHKFGGVVRKDHAGKVTMPGSPVAELQRDLGFIGYFVGPVTGVYNDATFWAVNMLQEHFFAGGRSTSSPTGKLNLETARIVKALTDQEFTQLVDELEDEIEEVLGFSL